MVQNEKWGDVLFFSKDQDKDMLIMHLFNIVLEVWTMQEDKKDK